MMFEENSTTLRSSFANRGYSGPSKSVASQEKMPRVEWNKTIGTASDNFPRGTLHSFPHTVGPLYSPNGDSFSSSLPVPLQEKLNLDSHAREYSNFGGSHIDGDFAEDALGPLDEEFIARAIGDLLPEDEEELLGGVAESLDFMHLNLDENDDFDLFSSGGGLELDIETQESFGSHAGNSRVVDGLYGSAGGFHGPSVGPSPVSGEHPFGEHPSRTLFVRNINSNVEDSELRELFEQYGDIRTLYTACKHRGFVMISYYDIRSARSAMRALQNKPLRRRKLDIHFSIPKDNPSDKDMNQGTLVVFNLDASVSNDDLCQIFGQYGEIKEIRETPHKRHHKFIEFYDVRAAEAALRALNRSDIAGKRIKLEPSRPGGARRNLTQQLTQELEDEARLYRPQSSPPWAKSPSGHFSAWGHFGSPVESGLTMSLHQSSLGGLRPGTLKPSLLPIHSSSMLPVIRGTHLGRGQFEGMPPFHNTGIGVKGSALHHAHSLPEYTDGMALSSFSPPVSISSLSLAKYAVQDGSDGSRFARASAGSGNNVSLFEHAPGAIGTPNGGSHSHSGSGSTSLSGPQFLWGDRSSHGQTSSSVAWSTSPISHSFTPPSQAQVQQFGLQGQFVNASLSSRRFQYGSAPPGDPSFLDRHHGIMRETDTSSFNLGLLGVPSMNTTTSCSISDFGVMGTAAGFDNCVSMSLGMMPSHRRSHLFQASGLPLAKNIDMLADRGRSRRTESSTSQAENRKQYQLDIDAILRGEDDRTTLMIKNIPNKYTSKMLLAAIDDNHRGMYDFMYLPIDFKNKCNVGYAFINMTSPTYIISIYETFNGKKWEKFNSEKVASLAYARIQGKAALVAHFENSSLMNEDKRCRPILFHSEGTENGDQLDMGDLEIASFQDGHAAATATFISNSPVLEAE